MLDDVTVHSSCSFPWCPHCILSSLELWFGLGLAVGVRKLWLRKQWNMRT